MRCLRPLLITALLLGLTACGGDSDSSTNGTTKQTIEQNGVEMTVPKSVSAGAPFEVKWSGPNESGDYISIAEKDSDGDESVSYTYTRKGSPLTIRPPDQPGSFQIRYVSGTNDQILADAPLTVEDVSATLNTPQEIDAGSPIEVSWKGPSNPGDYISIAEKGTNDDASTNYTYTRKGTPLTVRAPDTPGAYELRYVMGQSDRVIARQDVNVTTVSASFDVADTLMVNTPVELKWQGPDNPGDYIAISEKGTPDDASVAYTYTRKGNPLSIQTPESPGQYELRYVMAQSDRVLTRKPVAILPLQARLRAPDTISSGKGFDVSWMGPNGPNDFIAVSQPDASPSDYESRALSRAGNPATVYAPSSPGNYELRYIWAEEDSILTTKTINVEK